MGRRDLRGLGEDVVGLRRGPFAEDERKADGHGIAGLQEFRPEVEVEAARFLRGASAVKCDEAGEHLVLGR